MGLYEVPLFVSLLGFWDRGQVGLGVGSWPSKRGIESKRNPIILCDLTQECRKHF